MEFGGRPRLGDFVLVFIFRVPHTYDTFVINSIFIGLYRLVQRVLINKFFAIKNRVNKLLPPAK
jgi:hypothetical protein